MNKEKYIEIRDGWANLVSNIMKVGQFFDKDFNDYLRIDPMDDYLRVVFYYGIDNDHGRSLDLNIPYHLLEIDDTWQDRMIDFKMSTKWEIKH